VLAVVVLVVVVGVTHSPAVQAPLQHWWFPVQVERFGLQLALLGWAPALRGAAMRSTPPSARSRSSVGVIRSASLSGRDVIGFLRCASVTPTDRGCGCYCQWG